MLTDRGYDVAVNSLENGERITRTVVSTTKEAPVESRPIGRIDYLGTDGKVGESIEYTSPYSFEKDIKEENYYGVPMSIVLYKDKDGSTISHNFITQLDPPPKSFEIIDSPYLTDTALNKAKQIIDDFCREEYQQEDGADYTDLANVGVAYTTTEDDKHEIQARVNLVDFRIETLADGKVVRSEQYDSLEELTDKGLQALSFDDLVYLSEEELAQVDAPLAPAWERPKKSRVQSFDIHPEIPMADRHTFDLASHEVEEVNKKERFHRNYAAITVLKRCQEENRFATPDEQIILSNMWAGAVFLKPLTRTQVLGRLSMQCSKAYCLRMNTKPQEPALCLPSTHRLPSLTASTRRLNRWASVKAISWNRPAASVISSDCSLKK